MQLDGKVAIVTGAASPIGIGCAVAERFAREGARVVLADIDDDNGKDASAKINATGGRSIYCHTDVSDSAAVQRLIRAAVDTFGSLNILVNNAAHMKDYKAALDTKDDEWRHALDVNLTGPFLCSKHAIPEMINAGGGSIVNVASVGGLVGFAAYAAYCSAKGGLIQLTRSLAIDYGTSGIRVNAVCPGAIDTSVSPKGRDEAFYQQQKDMSVLGRTGQPGEVAAAILFLASDESSFVTGATLVVDGGWTVR